MKKITLLCFLMISVLASAQSVFINELHYDNDGADTGEAVEIAGPAGTDLSTYDLVFYNGANGNEYNTVTLSGTIDDEGAGFGAVDFSVSGIQNGAPDGIALVNNGTVIQFLSYEGAFTANDAVAAGMMSTDIGVAEPGNTPIGESLQLTGSGAVYTDFMWNAPAAESFGSINPGQTFVAAVPCAIDCPANINATADAMTMTANVTYADPTLTGDCTMAGFTQTAGLASGSEFPIGDTINTFEATDDNTGMTVSCSFTVTVESATAGDPEVVCQDITVELDENGQAVINPADVLSNTVFAGYELDQTGTFAPIDISGSGIDVTLGDDAVSDALPIGFDFDFYDAGYTDFYISSNGFITFSAGTGSGCCTGQSLPNTANPNNLIAFAWEDLDPGNGGQPNVNVVRYATTGTAPNRVLVMEFFNVDHFPSGSNVTTQVQLFEGSNRIEIHTTSMPSDGGLHTQGIENIDGTEALVTPGRNRANWSATNDFVSYTPRIGVPDNDGPATNLSLDVDTFGCSDTGDNTVTVTATDAMGNSASCTATVTVVLTGEAIVFDGCSPDIFTGTGNTQDCSAIVSFDAPNASSVCGTVTITQTEGPASGSVFPVGNTLVEYTAEVNGVTSTCSFTVNVTDTALPTLDCPGDLIVASDDAGNYEIEDYTAATDNCTAASDIVTTQEPAAGTIVTEGSTTTVTVTATDEAGNTTTCTFDILVDNNLSISDEDFSSALSIYPNPTSGQVTLSNASAATIESIKVVDVNGRVLSVLNTEVAREMQIDFAGYATGVYFIEITSGNTAIVKRVVKQ